MTTHPLRLTVHETPAALGAVTGQLAADTICAAIAAKGRARVMLAAAPSQTETLHALATHPFDPSAVDFFHMDDYLGLPQDAPQGFGNWLQRELFDRLPPGARLHRINAQLPAEQAAREYGMAMGDEPFDLTLCGLGVNAHLAFNDPPADLHDRLPVRVVDLDEVSRRQQVDEGHFPDMDAVPRQALTVTIPRLLNTGHVICSVVGTAKREAVRLTMACDPTPQVPGTALKTHPRAELHVDVEATR